MTNKEFQSIIKSIETQTKLFYLHCMMLREMMMVLYDDQNIKEIGLRYGREMRIVLGLEKSIHDIKLEEWKARHPEAES